MIPGNRRMAKCPCSIGRPDITRIPQMRNPVRQHFTVRARPITRPIISEGGRRTGTNETQQTNRAGQAIWGGGLVTALLVVALGILADCRRSETTDEGRTQQIKPVSSETQKGEELGQEEDKMCNWNSRFSGCSEEVSKMAEAGLFDEALKASLEKHSDCLIKIASELAKAELDKAVKADLFRKIIEAACVIEDLFERSKVLSEIAAEMAKAGLDRIEVNKAFQLAADAAKAVGGSECCGWGTRARALCIVASNKAEAGLFNDALMVARTIGVPWEKSMAFSEIAAEMAKAGWDKAEVSKAFQSAIDAAMAMQEDSFLVMNKPYALMVAVSGMVEAGLDEAELRKALQVYIKVLATAENQRILSAQPEQKGWVLDFIYSVGGKAGLNVDEVNKMLSDAGFSRRLD